MARKLMMNNVEIVNDSNIFTGEFQQGHINGDIAYQNNRINVANYIFITKPNTSYKLYTIGNFELFFNAYNVGTTFTLVEGSMMKWTDKIVIKNNWKLTEQAFTVNVVLREKNDINITPKDGVNFKIEEVV